MTDEEDRHSTLGGAINLYPYFLEACDAKHCQRLKYPLGPTHIVMEKHSVEIMLLFTALFKIILMGKEEDNVGC